MKPEKEMLWLFKLFLSPYAKQGLFGSAKTGCKKDFERLLNAPQNDSDFSHWLTDLIQDGCLEETGVVNNGGRDSLRTVRVYRVNQNRLLEKLGQNECYLTAREFFDARALIPGFSA